MLDPGLRISGDTVEDELTSSRRLASVERRHPNGGDDDDGSGLWISGWRGHPVPRADPLATHDGDGLTPREGGSDGGEQDGETAGVVRSPPRDVVRI